MFSVVVARLESPRFPDLPAVFERVNLAESVGGATRNFWAQSPPGQLLCQRASPPDDPTMNEQRIETNRHGERRASRANRARADPMLMDDRKTLVVRK